MPPQIKRRKAYLYKGSPFVVPPSTRLRRERASKESSERSWARSNRSGNQESEPTACSSSTTALQKTTRDSNRPPSDTVSDTGSTSCQNDQGATVLPSSDVGFTTSQNDQGSTVLPSLNVLDVATSGEQNAPDDFIDDIVSSGEGDSDTLIEQYGSDDFIDDIISSAEVDADTEFDRSAAPSREEVELLSGRLGEFQRKILPSSSTTVAEAVTMIIAFVASHGLSWTALDDLLRIINTFYGSSGPVLPASKYIFRKLWASKAKKLSKHFFYCKLCGSELTFPAGSATAKCPTPSCSRQHNLAQVKADGCVFTMLDFKSQVQHVVTLLGNDIYPTLVKHRNEEQTGAVVTDMTNAAHQLKLRREGNIGCNDLTITFNTDGTPIFKSSRSSIWPVQFIINEVPAALRFKNAVVAGLWFGPHHPNMPLFLSKFVDELRGATVIWQHNEETIKSNIYATCCCVDSPARAAVQNCVLFNGYFGCPWCYAPGNHDSGTMRYPYNGAEEERTSKSVADDMLLALESDCTVNGIKGPSPVMNLQHFDLVWSFSVEYMHAVFLGVSRQITECWLDSANNEERYYIGRPSMLSVLDRRLLSIKPPDSVTRLPRSLKDRKFWKASEWRMWLLFYSLPCLRDVLPHIYWAHFRSLLEAIFILVGSRLTEPLLLRAEKLLHKFVSRMASLYGDTMMTFNVHILLHLPNAVRHQGPLWTSSAFVFESGNGQLKKFITAANGVPSQVVERVVMGQELQHLLKCGTLSDSVQRVCMSMTGTMHIRNAINVDGIWLLGCPKPAVGLSLEEQEGVTAVCGGGSTSALEYVRFTFRKSIYHSAKYTKPTKVNTTVVRTHSGDILVIRRILYVPHGTISKCCLVCSKVFLTDSALQFPSHINECFIAPTGTTAVIAASTVEAHVLFIEFGFEEQAHVCTLPNMTEYD